MHLPLRADVAVESAGERIVPHNALRLLRAAVAIVLLLGGVGKFLSPDESSLAVLSMTSLSSLDSLRITFAVASVEIVAAVLIVLPSPWRRHGTLVGVGLFAVFAALVARRILLGESGPCGCFGSLVRVESNWAHLALVLVSSAILLQKAGPKPLDHCATRRGALS